MKWSSLVVILYFALQGCKSMPNAENQETAELHMQIAVSYIQKDNLPSALKELLIAEDLAPKNAAVQSNLGLVYFLRDRFELSERHYLQAISFRPDYTEAKNNLARVYTETGQYRKAEPLLQEALKDLTFNDYPSVYANYGILEFKRKHYASATNYLKKSLEIDRENCLTQVYLGRSYLDMNELTLASDQLEKAISFCQPQGIDEAHYYAALAYYRNSQRDRAMVRFEELIRYFPTGPNNEKAKKMLALIKKGTL
jgi:type IV pilus assembly protein PilF